MLEEIVVRLTVKLTDWELTSQKETRRPHLFDRGRYAISAADTAHRMLIVAAVKRRAIDECERCGVKYQLGSVELTGANVQEDCTSYEKSDDMNSVAD